MNALDRAWIRREIQHSEERMQAELERSLKAYTAVMRAELANEVRDIDTRITTVHDKAIRALTARANGGGTP